MGTPVPTAVLGEYLAGPGDFVLFLIECLPAKENFGDRELSIRSTL